MADVNVFYLTATSHQWALSMNKRTLETTLTPYPGEPGRICERQRLQVWGAWLTRRCWGRYGRGGVWEGWGLTRAGARRSFQSCRVLWCLWERQWPVREGAEGGHTHALTRRHIHAHTHSHAHALTNASTCTFVSMYTQQHICKQAG